MKKQFVLIVCILMLIIACKKKESIINLKSPLKVGYFSDTLKLSDAERYDKILGALVGSAIGDAMGASTEMWHRYDIQLKYGYINGLTPAIRNQSPEGTWAHNLMAGATTDDTRWKYLMVKYFSTYKSELNATNFAKFISEYYEHLVKNISSKETQKNPDALDNEVEKLDWIKEWARVAIAYQKGFETYQKAQNRFYGGEMSCAGQLYTPMFGLLANTPEAAYHLGYEHTLFDLGYAKDISALVAAITHTAMRTQNIDSIINTVAFVDPHDYQNSRLIGRITYSITDASVKNVLNVKQSLSTGSLEVIDSLIPSMPKGFKGTENDWVFQELIYQSLEEDEKAIAFHTGEIWQILITSLQFGAGDFTKTMQFIINYGRDNDTVAAIAGMILGAKTGYSNLPKDLKEEVVKVSKVYMGIDLEALAKEMASVSYN
ncbi:ADP-ribosylglycohydrolase family protein [uncultured Algibacter sp.]|uniref:ADP-ribosylglycohydrolase family protein n=1 Tax=uncultured Algibacter sp. TaxID=298659 RepID=UPI002637D3F4|nr:ADP-ribosylglycohydrolase family protein [uncultured Algibacter sp.]